MLALAAASPLDALDGDQWTATMLAANAGHWKIVRALARAGANLGIQDRGGDSALHIASANGSVEVVRELLRAGAPRGVANRDGNMPIHLACGKSFLLFACLLFHRPSSFSFVYPCFPPKVALLTQLLHVPS